VLKALSRCFIFILATFAHPQVASAYTECTINLARIYVGDDGYVWLHYTNGGSGYLLPADLDKVGTLSLATTALVAQRQMVVRYQADGVACNTASRSDLVGVYLL